MNPLLVPGEGTWSSRLGESGWPETGNNDSTDGKDWQPGGGVGGSAFTDLVPEFEPGKPWKVIPFLDHYYFCLFIFILFDDVANND